MLDIKQATTEKDFEPVRFLNYAFVDWLRQSFPDHRETIDKYFIGLKAEMASLPGEYTQPTGTLLLAYLNGEAAGTVASRKIGNGICEMKHMFVLPAFHGKGIGKALATELINRSRQMGYERMRLDTSMGQVAAQGLYRSLGFQEIEPYYELPEEMRKSILFFELRL
ncbi:MAG: putative N-acetyltransferase YsnE [Chloroflexota bacterium]|jgi:ribosomal protein S18 acetylase RimI-like enzyme